MSQTTMQRWLAAGIATGLLAACGGGGDSPARSPAQAAAWETPSCTSVLGTAALTYTRDHGQTRTPRQFELTPNHCTFGLAAFTDPNVLIALGDDGRAGLRLQRSTDAGCSWSTLSAVIDARFAIASLEAAQNVAYAWMPNETLMYRITSEGQVAQVVLPFADALKVDAQDVNHLRAARFLGDQGLQLLDSHDGGATWTKIGRSPPDAHLQPVVVFSSTNLDHALALGARSGAWVTFDGGNQWLQSTGFGDLQVPNGRSGAIGFDGQIVLLLVQDFPPLPGPTRPSGVYASHDGGISFTRVLTDSASTPLAEGGTHFWAHPGDPNVVYFEFANIGASAPSYLYRYDARTATVTPVSWPTREGSVSAMAFHPTDATVVYLALSITQPIDLR